MLRTSLIALILIIIATPSSLLAEEKLKALEPVIAARELVQPDLLNYTVTIETPRIEEMMKHMTSRIPDDVAKPPTPVITKFWQRNGEGVIFAEQVPQAPYVEKMMEQISGNLAIELHEMLLPADKGKLRQSLSQGAEIKSSEVSVADVLIKSLEISFAKPTDLDEAFYVQGMRLPQKQVTSLSFDIDTMMNCISELNITTANGLQLAVEIRYLTVEGGYIPERYQITSPDGKVDDLFEVSFLEAEGFQLPEKMHRIIRRPQINEELEVFFKDYQINRPVTDEIRARLKAQ